MTAAQGVELDERLEKCTALYATRCGAARGLIVDGSVSSGAASQLLCWEDGVLFPYPDKEEGGDVFARSQRSRTLSALGPQDLSGTGEVLIPEAGASIATLQSARRFYPVGVDERTCASSRCSSSASTTRITTILCACPQNGRII